MSAETRYPLGHSEGEIERLGLQHDAWRDCTLDLWRAAKIGAGMTVIDAGAGPGYASFDLAGLVGSTGRVIALERSERFVLALNMMAAARDIKNVAAIETDLSDYAWPASVADAVWCRWILAFVPNARRVIDGIAGALKPGGAAVFHEYFDYASWRLAPRSDLFESYVRQIIENWRASGGEPDIGLGLPQLLADAGLKIETLRPAVFAAKPGEAMWRWPASFARSHAKTMASEGNLSIDEARAVDATLEQYESDPNARVFTPGVVQIVARKSR